MSDALLFPGLTPARHRHVERFLRVSRSARARFEECSDVLGFDLEERYRTADISDEAVYEVAFLAINLAVVDWFRDESGVDPAVVGGQSFGGYCAAVFCGAVTMGDMAWLLARSAAVAHQHFSTAVEPTACVFFSRIGPGTVEELVDAALAGGAGWAEVSVRGDRGVYAVSGSAPTVARLEQIVRSRRGLVYHTVPRAEHCPRLVDVRALVKREVVDHVPFRDPDRLLVSDVTGEVVTTADAVAADLLDGWTHATESETLYASLLRLGVSRLVVPVPRGAFRGQGGGRFAVWGVSPADVSKAVG